MASVLSCTWNTLGLGVATTWVALGLVGIFQPARSAELFGVHCSKGDDDSRNSETGIAIMFGSRDLTIATILFALGKSGRDDEMGTAIFSTMIICATDIYLAWKTKRYIEEDAGVKMNFFSAFSRPEAKWFPVGLTSSFPDRSSEDETPNLKAGCKVFHVPRTNPSQGVEVLLEANASESLVPEEELKDQVLVFQYRGKFHAVDHVSLRIHI
ncbi:hypothetical protein G7046_g3886 [Stylonectria norvegica]|nr:hypothetical protein G7046_g3886 [Stylonectria norvegica]